MLSELAGKRRLDSSNVTRRFGIGIRTTLKANKIGHYLSLSNTNSIFRLITFLTPGFKKGPALPMSIQPFIICAKSRVVPVISPAGPLPLGTRSKGRLGVPQNQYRFLCCLQNTVSSLHTQISRRKLTTHGWNLGCKCS